MIIVICILYILISRAGKITPVFSSLMWGHKAILSPILSGFKNAFRRKPRKQQVIEDAFSVPIKDKKAITIGEKIADKGGDNIAGMVTEIGKAFADVDIRVKGFFIILLNIFFITGLIYHVIWMWQYWQVTVVLITLLFEFISWTKATYKKTNQKTNG